MKYPQLVRMPSAVSDWLEEQLDARGIDAAVYTRYVLSLLHRDTLDLVATEHDIQLPKEVRQCGRGRKRFRRPASWWSYVRADVEELRRSAAVECLMSASDQKCGIESLVDELCEKLKHFESGVSESSEALDKLLPRHNNNNNNNKVELGGGSPTDLATRYYAAFPPLSYKPGRTNLISTLIPHLYHNNCTSTSSRRKQVARKPSAGGRDQLHRCETMKSRCAGRPRFACLGRAKKGFGFARSVEKSLERVHLSDWDVRLTHGQSRAGDEGYATSDTAGVDEDASETEQLDRSNADVKMEALWDMHAERHEYDDLPVDIQELLSSPTDQNPAVHLLNVANKRRADKSTAFIQCGTNITSSIWSERADDDHDKSLYDLYTECARPDELLGHQFNSLSVAAGNTPSAAHDFASLQWELPFTAKKWSDADTFSYASTPPERIAVRSSLVTLNHSREVSCFKEVVPKQGAEVPEPSVCALNSAVDAPDRAALNEEEDLLTSTRTHFRPIKHDSGASAATAGGQYADGTTFAIRSSYERVNYRRSESGMLYYLDSGFDTPKKYMEYRAADGRTADFVLKFCVKQNEKCCQTELAPAVEPPVVSAHSPLEVPAKKRVLCDPDEFFFPGDDDLFSENVEGGVCECSCSRTRTKLATRLEPLFNSSAKACSVHGVRSQQQQLAVTTTTTTINNNNNNSGWRWCDKCNNNWQVGVWPKAGETWQQRDAQSWQHIWSSSEELCSACLGAPAGPGAPAGRSRDYCRLRDELSQDGEQLLSDLSCLQLVYMEQLPGAEPSCDLADCLAQTKAPAAVVVASATKERKRRHSSSQRRPAEGAAAVARSSWASATAEPLPPLLRPVTL